MSVEGWQRGGEGRAGEHRIDGASRCHGLAGRTGSSGERQFGASLLTLFSLRSLSRAASRPWRTFFRVTVCRSAVARMLSMMRVYSCLSSGLTFGGEGATRLAESVSIEGQVSPYVGQTSCSCCTEHRQQRCVCVGCRRAGSTKSQAC